jgi:hypothetical protein
LYIGFYNFKREVVYPLEKPEGPQYIGVLPILTKADTRLSGRLSLSIGFYILLRKVEHPLKKSKGCFKDRGTPLGVGVQMSISGKEQSLKPLKPSSSLCFIS